MATAGAIMPSALRRRRPAAGRREGLARALGHYLRASRRLAALGEGAAFERDRAMAARGRLVAALIAAGPLGAQQALAVIRTVED